MNLNFERYALWEKEFMISHEFKTYERFWRNKLKTTPESIKFYDTYPEKKSIKSKSIVFYIEEEKTEKFKKIAGGKKEYYMSII